MLEYVNRGFGEGHFATVTAWLVFAANIIVTGDGRVVLRELRQRHRDRRARAAVKAFAVIVVLAMTALNIAGSTLVARVQSLVVFVVIGILAVFAAVTITNMNPALLPPSTTPALQDIMSGVALTFFAFLGFGVVTFTAKDLADPVAQLPRAMAIAIGLATRSTSLWRSACSGR